MNMPPCPALPCPLLAPCPRPLAPGPRPLAPGPATPFPALPCPAPPQVAFGFGASLSIVGVDIKFNLDLKDMSSPKKAVIDYIRDRLLEPLTGAFQGQCELRYDKACASNVSSARPVCTGGQIYRVNMWTVEAACSIVAITLIIIPTSRAGCTLCPPAACTKDSYVRGVGTPLDTCPSGQEKQGALCYPNCPTDWQYG